VSQGLGVLLEIVFERAENVIIKRLGFMGYVSR